MAIGVLAIQGDVSEHYEAVKRAAKLYDIHGDIRLVRRPIDMENITHLIIPGGESTTISRIMVNNGLYDTIVNKARGGKLAVMGTCAGSILMAKNIIDDTRVHSLKLIDMNVRRNAFGRQKDSFEADVNIEGFEKYHAVFIRAPIIERCYGACQVLGKVEDRIIMVRQGRFIALVFHPELTEDLRIYREFFKL